MRIIKFRRKRPNGWNYGRNIRFKSLHNAEYPIKQSLNECPYMTVPLLQFDLDCDSIEVLGNSFDNPELLKGGQDGQTAE